MTKRFISIAALLLLLMASAFVPVALADDDDDDDGGGGGQVTVVHTQAVVGACVPSSASDQLCDPKSPISFSGEADRVTFTVSPGHCSSVRVQLFIDGVGQGWSPFLRWFGEPTLPASFTWDVDIDSGDVLELQAEGRVGGCNAGVLGSWGGTVTIEDEAGGDDDDDDDEDDDDEDDDDDDDD